MRNFTFTFVSRDVKESVNPRLRTAGLNSCGICGEQSVNEKGLTPLLWVSLFDIFLPVLHTPLQIQYKFLLVEGQMDKVWETSKTKFSFGYRTALDRYIFSLIVFKFHGLFEDLNLQGSPQPAKRQLFMVFLCL
jgi:hypothetical protein